MKYFMDLMCWVALTFIGAIIALWIVVSSYFLAADSVWKLLGVAVFLLAFAGLVWGSTRFFGKEKKSDGK